MDAQVFIEAAVVGLMVVVVGSLTGLGISYIAGSELPDVCRSWNKYYVMEITLFLTGFITHLLCELLAINKWYCFNGAACAAATTS